MGTGVGEGVSVGSVRGMSALFEGAADGSTCSCAHASIPAHNAHNRIQITIVFTFFINACYSRLIFVYIINASYKIHNPAAAWYNERNHLEQEKKMKALITGASSGIGKAIAKVLSEKGYDLIISARREDKLEELKNELKTEVRIITADLSKEEECFRLHEEAGDIDILINNAGYGVFGAFDTTDLSKELNMLDLNIISVHILTKLFLQDFVKKNSGSILNVASSAAFMPGPLFSSYYASKAYVLRLTQAIYQELKKAKSEVYIGALCPGPVNTEFNKTAGVEFAVGGLSADYVAEYTVRKMFSKKNVIVPGAIMKGTRFFAKILPDSVVAKAAYMIQKSRRG